MQDRCFITHVVITTFTMVVLQEMLVMACGINAKRSAYYQLNAQPMAIVMNKRVQLAPNLK